MFINKSQIGGWGGYMMNMYVTVEQLNRQGIVFAIFHTIVFLNLAIDFALIPLS